MIGNEIDHPHWHDNTECDARVRITHPEGTTATCNGEDVR